MKDNALRVNPYDNVVIAIQHIGKGDAVTIGSETLFNTVQDIEPSHKIAVIAIKSGERVIRYGEPILEAMVDIPKGGWVHVHNAQPIIIPQQNERKGDRR